MQRFFSLFKMRKSLLFHIATLFVALLLPLQILCIFIFVNGYSIINKQLQNESISSLHYISEGISTEINSLRNTLYELGNNSELRYISNKTDFLPPNYYHMTISQLQEHLKIIEDNNQWISSIYIYLVHNKYYFSSKNNQDNLYDQYDENHDFMQLMRSARANGTQYLCRDDNGEYLILLYPWNSYYLDKKPKHMVQIYISEDYISQYLASRKINDLQTTVMFNHHTGNCWYDANSNAQTRRVFEEFQKNTLENTEKELSVNITNFSYDDTSYRIFSCYCPDLDVTFYQIIPLHLFMQPIHHYILGLIFYILLSLILFLFVFSIIRRMIYNPIQKFIDAFNSLEQGIYSTIIEPNNTEEFVHLTNGFNHMVVTLNDTINRLYKQKIYSQRMELSQLQQQINPHFLFNSYFMMNRLITQEDYVSAAQLSEHLGEYFRHINRDARSYVELSIEWTHMHSYAMVQQMRYYQRMKLDIQEVPAEFQNYIVPRLILQPLIENSIEHGLSHVTKAGLSRLFFICEDDILRIVIEDNGEISEDTISELNHRLCYFDTPGQELSALINIHRRLQLYYGETWGLRLFRSELGGLRIELNLPRIRKEINYKNDKHVNCR